MADRYWVGGTASWDGTAGTKWALTSGGAGGQAVPTATDNVFFDAASGTITVTHTANVSCASLDFSGFTGTFSGSTAGISIFGNFIASSTMTWSHTASLSFNAASGNYTLTTNGKAISSILTIGGATTTATWTLGDALNNTNSNGLFITRGTFTTNNFNLTVASIQSSNSNTRTIDLGSSTVTLTGASLVVNCVTSTNLNFIPGTSTIICSGTGPQIMFGSDGFPTSATLNNLTLTNTTAGNTPIIRGNLTLNNLTVAAPSTVGVTGFQFEGRQTINGILSTTGTAGNRRVWFRSQTYGIAQTLTVNSAPNLTDADFRDIYVIGTAAPISGTRIGDLRGCSGITFSTPKTVYWNLAGTQSWSANAWAATSTGAPSTDNFPLAQDTATFTNAGSVTATITMDGAINYTGTVNMSGRTSAMTLAVGTAFTIYGNWTNGSGTTMSGSGTLTYSGRNTQTITSAGKTFNGGITVDTYGGSVELADALNILGTSNLTVTNGTFDTKNYAVTAGSLSSNNSNVRAINLGSSTITLSTGNTPLDFTTSTNLSFNCGTSSISFTGVGVLFSTGNQTFYDVTFANTNVSTSDPDSMSGSATFRNFTIVPFSTTSIRTLGIPGDQIITGTLTVAGATPTRRIFIYSTSTLNTPRTLTVGTLAANDCDFRDIVVAGAAANSAPTRAGDCGGNSGITFPAAKTVYWNLAGTQNWSATAWADVSGGTPGVNNFPLAQDIAVFDNTGVAGTVTIDQVWNISTFDASARTTAMTFSTGTVDRHRFCGDFIAGSGVTVTSGGALSQIAGNKLQTINMNGVAWGAGGIEVAKHPGTTLQLASSLNVVGRAFNIVIGNFDAVNYNFTSSTFSAASNVVLRMGSGTWTLTGTGTVFSLNTGVIFYKGTADIVLSSTSTAARTFTGGGFSHNKLTIGGATGISTLTISDSNQFTELASTKTVAHTIDFGSTTQTFGKWTVSGTPGNAVTVNGSGTAHVIAGARVSGIDYVNMYIAFSVTSPGEFYAGANSVGTAFRIINTAAPAPVTRYWVNGTGNWDSANTTRWSVTSGGPGGASAPTSADDVIFDAASSAGSYTVTLTGTNLIRFRSLTIAAPASGTITLAGTAALCVHGSVTLPATGLTRTYTGAITLSGSTAGNTFTSNGVGFANAITVNGVGCEWTLGSALTNSTTSDFTITNGTFNASSYTSQLGGGLVSANANSRTINFGSATVALTWTNPLNFGTTETQAANLTVIAGSSQINITQAQSTFSGNGKTFYNVAFTSQIDQFSKTINGTNTFNNLTVIGPDSLGVPSVSISANQTINGTLTISAGGTNAICRTVVRSSVLGTPRTLTCNAFSGTDVDFRDIVIAGAAAPVSGTRLGDCKGNSGITFDAAKTVYWNLTSNNNWSATAWATSDGGTPAANNFPLAQDTAVFTSTRPSLAATITVNAAYNIGTIDMSARTTNVMTLATGSNAPTIYGNWINGTGTTLTGSGNITFAGRNTQTITSAGKTFTQPLYFNNLFGSITLQDSITLQTGGISLSLVSGTFNTNNFSVTGTSGGSGFDAQGSITRILNMGSTTWTFVGSGTVWNTTTSTNLSVTGTGTVNLTSASAKTFAGGGVSYAGITLNQGGAGTLTITGNNTFADITNTYSATAATTIALGNTTQRVGKFTASGTAGKVLTVTGTSASSPATLIYTGSGEATAATTDYLNVIGVRAYNLADTWKAGANSTNGGSLGWIFAAGTVVALAASTFFLMF